ncbi:cytochrome P450 CYP82D47-like [Tripterygium wilfordii]|uniref:cytochrome P450 CYP82D47-like n=1 Tax=Tripterygium wilfordii TaxID=458696 RepID=UPI0018F83A9B|nr:cytochrome P450 CYP82D47-like [Tripterygium wilfordii]
MESLLLLQVPTPVIAATTVAIAVFIYYLCSVSRKETKNLPPEAAGARPFMGHLHLLGGSRPTHLTLADLADKTGPIFTIRLGVHRALVVSDWKIAKECFTTNDMAFANRPKALAPEILGYNYAMFGFSPYGPYWRQVRKIATLELLSNRRLELLKQVRESEVKASIKEIYELWSKSETGKALVEMKRWFGDINLNVVFRMVVGKRYVGATTEEESEENERCRKALRDFFTLTGSFPASDALPYLRRFDLGGTEKAMKKSFKELDKILDGWLEEHRKKKGNQDFMDVLISILDDASDLPSYDADTIIKATCVAIMLGATDTTTVTLTWALSLLINHPHVLEKAQQELDNIVGRERPVEDSDVKDLVYLQAITKEVMRLYPAAPLSVPHESSEDCTLSGYHIPAGTRLLVNLSKLLRDPDEWSEPNEFRPERFLTTQKDFDVRGASFEYIPFGTGRRVCPGISFALQVMHLTLAKLLHGFEISSPTGGPVDMVEGVGLTNLKAHPLEVHFSPRHPAHLYD